MANNESDWLKERKRLVERALADLKNCSGPDGSYEQAYHALQRSADRMDDKRFMFEAGRRSMRLEVERETKERIRLAVAEAVKGVFNADK